MKKILVVVDMQNDFITGPLGTPEAVSIVDKVVEKIRGEEWDRVYATKDTHDTDYEFTQEGRNLPIDHCVETTDGWYFNEKIHEAFVSLVNRPVSLYKNTFGSVQLVRRLDYDMEYVFEDDNPANYELTLVGVCTDICVISNALLLKAHYPEMRIVVDASCCAGSTPFRHREALDVMRSCQIDIVNEPKMTNGDKVHMMNNEELASLIADDDPYCSGGCSKYSNNCIRCAFIYLNKESEE